MSRAVSAAHVVVIYCDDKSHPTKRATVESFGRADDGPWDLVTRSQGRGTRVILDRASEVVDDQGSSVVDVEDSRDRLRYTIRCSLCGLSVAVRAETIVPILDRVAAANADAPDPGGFRVSRVPLRWLTARLASGNTTPS